MPEYVKLQPRDLERLIDLCELFCEYKSHALRPVNWQQFQQRYLPSLVEQLRNNQFKVVDVHNNTLAWIIDQTIHSRRVVEGIPRRDWIPLTDFEWIQQLLTVLRHAQRGQVSYDTLKQASQFHNLFR